MFNKKFSSVHTKKYAEKASEKRTSACFFRKCFRSESPLKIVVVFLVNCLTAFLFCLKNVVETNKTVSLLKVCAKVMFPNLSKVLEFIHIFDDDIYQLCFVPCIESQLIFLNYKKYQQNFSQTKKIYCVQFTSV